MSLKTLLERFVRGLPLPSASGYGEAFYSDDEEYMVNPATLDIAEKHQLVNENKNKIYDIQKQLKEQQQQEIQEKELARQQQESEKNKSQVATNVATVQ